MDEQHTISVGIDVSTDHPVVHLRTSDKSFHVARDAKGLDTLARRLRHADSQPEGQRARRCHIRRRRWETYEGLLLRFERPEAVGQLS